MKILTTLKRVEDYESKIKVRPDQTWIVTEGVNYRANPFDEIAVEEALRLRDANMPSEVVVVSVGPAAAATEIRSGNVRVLTSLPIAIKAMRLGTSTVRRNQRRSALDGDLVSAPSSTVQWNLVRRMDPRSIVLGFARRSDAHTLALMSRDLIEAGLGWEYRTERIARLIADPETVALAARDGKDVIGFAVMTFGDERAHLTLLAVSPPIL